MRKTQHPANPEAPNIIKISAGLVRHPISTSFASIAENNLRNKNWSNSSDLGGDKPLGLRLSLSQLDPSRIAYNPILNDEEYIEGAQDTVEEEEPEPEAEQEAAEEPQPQQQETAAQ